MSAAVPTRTPDIISFTPLLRSTAADTAAVERLQAATLDDPRTRRRLLPV